MKVLEYAGLALIVVLFCLAGLVFVAPRFGWHIDAVLSGSMEPELHVGSIAVIRPLPQENFAVGDIITFYAPLTGAITSHRVVEVVPTSSRYYRTKGDANEDADPILVPQQNIIGKVCFSIPYVGYVSKFIKSRLGLVLAIYIPGLMIIAVEIRNIWTAFVFLDVNRRYRAG